MCYMLTLTSASSRTRRAAVGVRELRQNLSVYLDRVKQGEALTVTEHGQVVAVVSPASRPLSAVERLVAEGRATPASRSLLTLRPRVRARRGDRPSEQVIADLREERLT